jgi:hypothetical protein
MDNQQLPIDAKETLSGMGIDLEVLAASGNDLHKPFTEAVFAPIAEKYGFQPDGISIARLILNVAVGLYRLEAKWTATNLSKVRKKLAAVEKHSRALRQALQDLDEEDLYTANQASIAQGLATNPDTMGMLGKALIVPSPSLTWDGQEAALKHPDHDPLPLSELTATLESLDQAISLSQHIARKGKTGRREDATLEALLFAAFQMYENFTGKRFTLDWHKDNAPNSEGAYFSVDIVRVFDSKIPASKIVSTSTDIRKVFIKVSDLEEARSFVSHYSERFR